MDTKISEVYHTILQNQGHCLEIELKNYFHMSTDYADPVYYKTRKKTALKAYILLFFCRVTRAVLIELVPNFTTAEFIECCKRLILTRGKHKLFYSNSAKTSKAREVVNKHKKRSETPRYLIW